MSGEQKTNEGTAAIAANGRVDRNVGRRILWRNVPLIPLTVLVQLWELWHFGPSQKILRAGRRYKKWLLR